jgi:hypothetical protein
MLSRRELLQLAAAGGALALLSGAGCGRDVTAPVDEIPPIDRSLLPVVVANNSVYVGWTLSDGTTTSATFRSRHVASRAITAIGLTYLNGHGRWPTRSRCPASWRRRTQPLRPAIART